MKKLGVAIVLVPAFLSIATVAQRLSYPPTGPAFPAAPVAIGGANLPFQTIGASDLIHLTVSDSPELSQSFRVDKQGNLNLPLLRAPLHAEGLMPDELRDQLAAALRRQHLLIQPVVVVSVVEYRSRDVVIAGAVKTPSSFRT